MNSMHHAKLVWVLALGLGASAWAQTPAEKGQAAVDRALAYLAGQQKPDGSWNQSGREPPAVTALIVRAMARDPKFGPESDAVKKGVDYLLTTQKNDGSLHGGMMQNYNTAIIVSALALVDDAKAKDAVEKAVTYLKTTQHVDKDASGNDPQAGGWNYGGERGGVADLSNTAVVLEALRDSGVKEDDPAYKQAMAFVTRMQNRSESNPADWAGNDGGFIYSPGPDGKGQSSAGDYQDEQGQRRVRSYGAMTYAGLKSMIYAGLAKDDPRVRSAWSWVQNNWTLEENAGMAAGKPGEGKAGLFYYYYTLARALDAYDQPVIETTDPKASHDWRVELIDKLASVQQDDGSFVGTRQFMESSPVIATPLATLALQDALSDLKQHPAR